MSKQASKGKKELKQVQDEVRTVSARNPANMQMKQMQEVMKSIMAPGLASDVRYSTSGIGGPTSVAQFTNPVDMTLDSATTDQLPAYESAAFVFRDPVRNMVFYDPNPASAFRQAKYALFFNRVSGETDVVDISYAGAPGPLEIAYAVLDEGISTFAPHGNFLGTGLANGNKTYVWNQTNYVWAATYTGGENMCLIRVYRWTPRGEVYVGEWADGNLSAITGNGYVRFEAFHTGGLGITPTLANVDGLNLSFTIGSGKSVFCHRSLVQYEDKAASVEKVRILSQAMLVSNLTPEISKGGKIASKQLPGDEPWYEYAFGGYNAIARLVHADVRPAENGLYGYLKPTTIQDYEMTDYVDSSDGVLVRFGFPLDSVRAYLGTYLSLPAIDGQNMQLTSLTNVEFESDDQWYQQGVSGCDSEVFSAAIRAVANQRQFDENPLHIDDIMKAVRGMTKKAVDLTLKYGPTALKVATFVGSLL